MELDYIPGLLRSPASKLIENDRQAGNQLANGPFYAVYGIFSRG
jgi:hypothetical protein